LVKAYVAQKKFDEAVKIGEEGAKSLNDPAMLRKELAKATQLRANEEKQRKQLYAKMMKSSFPSAGRPEPEAPKSD